MALFTTMNPYEIIIITHYNISLVIPTSIIGKNHNQKNNDDPDYNHIMNNGLYDPNGFYDLNIHNHYHLSFNPKYM